MERLVNDAIAEAIAQKVATQTAEVLEKQWSIIIEELTSTRKINEQLSQTIKNLQTQIANQTETITENLQVATAEIARTRENNLKASQILTETLKDLGIEE